MNQQIVAGFPGIGKSHLFKNPQGFVVADSDSSLFSWADPVAKVRDPEWPKNYIRHIFDTETSVDILCVSTHKEVRDEMAMNGIRYNLVYPALEMKDEYIQRYKDRGSDPGFIALLEKMYEAWINELSTQKGCKHIVLQPGQYLSDVLPDIITYRLTSHSSLKGAMTLREVQKMCEQRNESFAVPRWFALWKYGQVVFSTSPQALVLRDGWEIVPGTPGL